LPLFSIDNFELLEEFANEAPEPRRIVKFTKKYGPLMLRSEAGQEFEFSIVEWQRYQAQFREAWERDLPRAGKYFTGRQLMFYADFPVEEGELWEFVGGRPSFQTSTLYRLLLLELASVSWDDRRKCKRDGCQNPYYISGDRKRRYCSEECNHEAGKAAKRKWERKNRHRITKKPRRSLKKRS
jgi:hypothetical protein